ncbi:Protein BPS1, chloroplastic [Apostasia shenzhenica]|uniref:Protein BPS1, chloroplastic n=1 Tax=Apostasia shenzhenica TaxID=1088818 RepID=A0A2I0AX54_9ASPA|nr:Protein BPS1, chloroplastic [Apostasia shenzhenica]
MSRADDVHHTFLPFGNPFKNIFSWGSHLSPKLLTLLNDFELKLSTSLKSLIPKESSEILGLSWMIKAVESISEIHKDIKDLITVLQFPLSDWDEKWIDVYLESSVNLLDVCIALILELSRLDRGRLLLQYALHILDPLRNRPSTDQLKRAESTLRGWTKQFDSKNPKLESCYSTLCELAKTLFLGKVKNSSKGKVLIRALYGVMVETIFVSSIIMAELSGWSKPPIELHVPDKFSWHKAFDELQGSIIAAATTAAHNSSRKMLLFKELEAVGMCVGRLIEEGERLQELVVELGEKAEKLSGGLEILSNKIDDFFQIVLSGRDALLYNLREGNEEKIESNSTIRVD